MNRVQKTNTGMYPCNQLPFRITSYLIMDMKKFGTIAATFKHWQCHVFFTKSLFFCVLLQNTSKLLLQNTVVSPTTKGLSALSQEKRRYNSSAEWCSLRQKDYTV